REMQKTRLTTRPSFIISAYLVWKKNTPHTTRTCALSTSFLSYSSWSLALKGRQQHSWKPATCLQDYTSPRHHTHTHTHTHRHTHTHTHTHTHKHTHTHPHTHTRTRTRTRTLILPL